MVYKVLEETVTDEEQGQRLTYGIIAGAAVVSDISDKREAVERLVGVAEYAAGAPDAL